MAQPLAVQRLLEMRVAQQRLGFGGEQQHIAIGEVVQRLDTEVVAGHEQAAGFAVVQRESEHAAQAGQQLFAPFLEAVQDHFAVAMGFEHVARLHELGPQLLEVVDFTVEAQHQLIVFVVQRLASAFKVDDGQATEA